MAWLGHVLCPVLFCVDRRDDGAIAVPYLFFCRTAFGFMMRAMANSSLIQHILDLLFPRVCVGCSGLVDSEFRCLCWDCFTQIKPVAPPFCALCGDPAHGEVDGAFLCAGCRSRKPHFDCARSAVHYTGLAKDMILDFKYRAAVWLAADFGRMLAACAQTHYHTERIDAVACVPLHSSRERRRTYNQSRLLARELSAQLGVDFGEYLVRQKQSVSQTHLTAAAREANVKGSFVVREHSDPAGKSILLVDDVMTTGATVNECARVLKVAGADEVLVLTAARG